MLSREHICQKLLKSVDGRWSYSVEHQCCFLRHSVLICDTDNKRQVSIPVHLFQCRHRCSSSHLTPRKRWRVDLGQTVDEQRWFVVEADDGRQRRVGEAVTDGASPRPLDRRQHGAQPRTRPVGGRLAQNATFEHDSDTIKKKRKHWTETDESAFWENKIEYSGVVFGDLWRRTRTAYAPIHDLLWPPSKSGCTTNVSSSQHRCEVGRQW